MKTRFAYAVTLLAVALLAGSSVAAAERFSERFERDYDVRPDVLLRLANTNGSVTVESWDQDRVRLVAEKSVSSRSEEEARKVLAEYEILVDETPSLIEVETRQPPRTDGFFDWLFGRARNVSVRYEIRVPREAELDLRTVNGSVRTDGSAGGQRLRSTNGRIEVDAAERHVDARTTNGSIRVEVMRAAPGLEIDLGSTNGALTLALPDDARARLDARTTNGSVRTELPLLTHGTDSRRRLSGELNGGGDGNIRLRTTNGSIRIERSTL